MFNHSPQVPTSYFGIISLDYRVIVSTPGLFWGSRYVNVMADYVYKATPAYSCRPDVAVFSVFWSAFFSL